MSGVALRRALAEGTLNCARVVGDLLARIDTDPLHAWTSVDPDALRRRATELDALPTAVRSRLPLFGIPIAIKDNFDTAQLPTAYGSPTYAGYRPRRDAGVVARLQSAGAIIAGKTQCAEFAWMTAPETRHPSDPRRTPGGSSTGSAVAVAAGHVPLATGTQTAGSINRPASYCGVLGLKPSFGRLPRDGVKLLAPSLDTVGLIGRDVEDLRLAMGALGVDRVSRTRGASAVPRVAIARTSLWTQVEDEVAEAVEAWLQAARDWGLPVAELELPEYERLIAAQTTIQLYESARALAGEQARHPGALSPALSAAIGDGLRLSAAAHGEALAIRDALGPALLARLDDFDAVLTPSATGVAPFGLAFTGDPLFCRVWTLLGAPSLSLPLVTGADGLPGGLQLVGVPGGDASVLDVAEVLLGMTNRPVGEASPQNFGHGAM